MFIAFSVSQKAYRKNWTQDPKAVQRDQDQVERFQTLSFEIFRRGEWHFTYSKNVPEFLEQRIFVGFSTETKVFLPKVYEIFWSEMSHR